MPSNNDRICSFEGCMGGDRGYGLCSGHLQQYRKGKTLTRIVKLTPKERFLTKVRKSSDCWEWLAGKTPDGYGLFSLNGTMTTAHRAAWTLFCGPIPEGRQIDHMCHNRACVNPEHLHTVSRKENMENRAGAHRNSQSGVRGVFPRKGRWVAVVGCLGKKHDVGSYDTIAEAEAAVIAKRNELFTNNLLDRRVA